MTDVVVGLVAILVGLAFCLRGYVAMRLVIPLWGAFAGFMLGAGLVSGASNGRFLATAAAWLVGLVVGLVFGALAYLYYEVTIVMAMATVGFALGATLLSALGVSWSWLVVVGGIAAGLALAVLAIRGNFPALLLVALTALGGASTTIFGVMLLIGTVDSNQLESADATEHVTDNGWWYVAYLALAIFGVVAQARHATTMRATAREHWQATTP